jgi:hypothetical protein
VDIKVLLAGVFFLARRPGLEHFQGADLQAQVAVLVFQLAHLPL